MIRAKSSHKLGAGYMRRAAIFIAFLLPFCAEAASAKLKKVLPHFLDREGRHTLSPSLFERDAYQLYLREHPEMRSAIGFDVQWKGSKKMPVVLRVELRGSRNGAATRADLESAALTGRGWLSRWSAVTLAGDRYKEFGDVVAWRATVWSANTLMAEQTSFLW